MRRVLKFYADWCSPCKTLSKTLEGVQTEVIIENINIDDNFKVSQEYGIRSIPTMVMLDENTEVKRKTGMMTKEELEVWLNG
jgi:thioredoxin 1